MVEHYRNVVEADAAAEGVNRAIGSFTPEHWLEVGEMQFNYLVDHGLRPHHRVLELGCGNLRAGWRLIEYLDAGNYTGTDISPSVLASARKILAERNLEEKDVTLLLVDNMALPMLADNTFDVIHAHSVFSHLTEDVIDDCIATASRLITPGGFFDFTYIEGTGNVKLEDFYYPAEFFEALAGKHGFASERLNDWRYSQEKMRFRPLIG
jgi:ubiquinone/menaquinone biosynthesis C-methylase UbiE